jgi:hypothetical protein
MSPTSYRTAPPRVTVRKLNRNTDTCPASRTAFSRQSSTALTGTRRKSLMSERSVAARFPLQPRPMSPLDRTLSRRRLLETLGLAGSALLSGCSSSPLSASSTGISTSTSASEQARDRGFELCRHAEETAGPYPDRLGMLSQPAFFRRDITAGRSGLSLALTLTVVNVAKSCAALANASVEILAVRRVEQLLGIRAARLQQRRPEFLRACRRPAPPDASPSRRSTPFVTKWRR